MLTVLAGWIVAGFLVTLIVGTVLELIHSLSRLQTAVLSWLLGSTALGALTFWALTQDPVPFTSLQNWQEDLIRRLMPERAIALRELPHGAIRVHDFRLLDTDDDQEMEWLGLYYQEGSESLCGYVFDADVGTPGIVYPYPLHTPDDDYLGERDVKAATAQVIAGSRPELVIWESQTLSIFRVSDRPGDARQMVAGSPPRYQNIGFFRGDLVRRQGDQVTVWQRQVMERSQLAIRSVYEPDPTTRSYFQEGSNALLPPVEKSVGLLPERPSDILNSPYPEKVVVAFYVDAPAESAQNYLVQDLRDGYLNGSLEPYGAPWPRSDLDRFLVYEVRYKPPPSGEATATVTVTVSAVRSGDLARAATEPVSLVWTLVKQGGQWKMKEVQPR